MCEQCEELRQEHSEARQRWSREKVALLMGETPWSERYRRLVVHLRDRLAKTQNECNRLAYVAFYRRELRESSRRWNARAWVVYNAAMAAYRGDNPRDVDLVGELWRACGEVEGE